MFTNSSSPSPGGRFLPDLAGYARPRHDNPVQERGRIRRGSPVYRHASPSPSRHRHRHPRASPSPSRRPSKPHRQHSRDHQVHSRSRPIAIPDYRHHVKSGNSSRTHHQPEYDSSRISEDSVSSSVSSSGSLFDRRGAVSGYSSSHTSLEDDTEPSKRGSPPEVRKIREKQNQDYGVSDCLGGATVSTLPEDGNSVWSRVATAASTLTVSVSKAWAANVTTNSGEDTPPGEESRLLRAMKAYHLDKARDPSDLPSWLFNEQERRPLGQLRLGSRHDYTDGSSSVQPTPLSPRGLRDIYDTAVTSPTSPRSDAPASKAASHLKALRDAKRNVLIPNSKSPREETTIGLDEVQHRKRAQRRMGMPVGPGMKHGRF